MKVEFHSREELIEILKDWETGPILSLYLPFGISGSSEDKCRIARKNTLDNCLEHASSLNESLWSEVIQLVETDSADPRTMQGYPFPHTKVYFCDGKALLRTDLTGPTQAHFGLGNFPELEPLVYDLWQSDEYLVIDIAADAPKLYRGRALQIEQEDVELPPFIKQTYANRLEELTLTRVAEEKDWPVAERTNLQVSSSGRLYSPSHPKDFDSEKQLKGYYRVLSEALSNSLGDWQGVVFVMGSDRERAAFEEALPLRPTLAKYDLSPECRGDKNRMAIEAAKLLTEKRLEQAVEEIRESETEESIEAIRIATEQRRVKKLYVNRNDRFSIESDDGRGLRMNNPRSLLIQRALRNNSDIAYVDDAIANELGLAAQLRG